MFLMLAVGAAFLFPQLMGAPADRVVGIVIPRPLPLSLSTPNDTGRERFRYGFAQRG